MSEFIAQGPLDLARSLNYEASSIDAELRVMTQTNTSPQYKRVVEEEIERLNGLHPLIGSKVIAYGAELSPSIEEGRLSRFMTIPMQHKRSEWPECKPEAGTYHGYFLMPAVDSVSQAETYTLAHRVAKSQRWSVSASTGERHEITSFSYVSALGSELVPVLPKNAHSLEDLASDNVVRGFDQIVFGEDDIANKLRAIGNLGMRALTNLRYEDEMNQQRVSYLNSLGILDGQYIVARDMLVENGDGRIDFDSLNVSSSEQLIEVAPKLFDTAHAYDRDDAGKVEVYPDSVDLYAWGKAANNLTVLVPLRNVEQVYSS